MRKFQKMENQEDPQLSSLPCSSSTPAGNEQDRDTYITLSEASDSDIETLDNEDEFDNDDVPDEPVNEVNDNSDATVAADDDHQTTGDDVQYYSYVQRPRMMITQRRNAIIDDINTDDTNIQSSYNSGSVSQMQQQLMHQPHMMPYEPPRYTSLSAKYRDMSIREYLHFVEVYGSPRITPNLPFEDPKTTFDFIRCMEIDEISIAADNIGHHRPDYKPDHRPWLQATLYPSPLKRDIIQRIMESDDLPALYAIRNTLTRNITSKTSKVFKPITTPTDILKHLPRDCRMALNFTQPAQADFWFWYAKGDDSFYRTKASDLQKARHNRIINCPHNYNYRNFVFRSPQ